MEPEAECASACSPTPLCVCARQFSSSSSGRELGALSCSGSASWKQADKNPELLTFPWEDRFWGRVLVASLLDNFLVFLGKLHYPSCGLISKKGYQL